MLLVLFELLFVAAWLIVYCAVGAALHSGKRVARRILRALRSRTRDDAETKGKAG